MAGQTLGAGWVINVLASKLLVKLPHPLQFLCYGSDVFPLGKLGKLIMNFILTECTQVFQKLPSLLLIQML